MGGGGGEIKPLKFQGALLRSGPRIPKGSLASELSVIAAIKIMILGAPHNLVCPGAPTGLNPALLSGVCGPYGIWTTYCVGVGRQ